MSATSPETTRSTGPRLENGRVSVRRSTETKASFKTTEFIAYLAVLVGIFIAGAVTTGGHAHDVFRASQVWLYAAVLTVGYMISRGLAKSGSRDPYTEER
jgi:hypothetical protein